MICFSASRLNVSVWSGSVSGTSRVGMIFESLSVSLWCPYYSGVLQCDSGLSVGFWSLRAKDWGSALGMQRCCFSGTTAVPTEFHPDSYCVPKTDLPGVKFFRMRGRRHVRDRYGVQVLKRRKQLTSEGRNVVYSTINYLASTFFFLIPCQKPRQLDICFPWQ